MWHKVKVIQNFDALVHIDLYTFNLCNYPWLTEKVVATFSDGV